MSVYTDEEVMEMLTEAFLAGRDVEDPSPVRRRTARARAEDILSKHDESTE